MTVNEAIVSAGAVCKDAVSREELITWLSEVENTVIEEIAKTHEGKAYDDSVITLEVEGDRVLFAPDPYSQLYVHYLIMKSDDILCDTERYVNSASRFSSSYSSFADWYNRTYMPLGANRIKV